MPDHFFVIFKIKYRKTAVDTHEDLLNCVVASSPSGHNRAVSGKKVLWYNLDEHLKKFFNPLIGITKYHHFVISSNGKVKGRMFADSEEVDDFQLLSSPLDDSMPTLIHPKGMSLE